jgi:protein involved in polysaccharide export with SLBB domain
VLKAVLRISILLAIPVGIAAQTATEKLQLSQFPPLAPNTGGVEITNMPGETQQFRRLDQQSIPTNAENPDAAKEAQRPNPAEFSLVPAEPDIEFQDFVATSLGYRLPIFGQNLFQNVSSTFAPLDRVPVTPDYLVGPGDELLIRAWGQVTINYRAVVDRTGSIFLPKVGEISVAGVRYDQLNSYMKGAISRVFKNFELNVTLGRLRSIQVFVVGQVKRPGAYTVSSLSTLVNALFASGGPSKRGSLRNIQLKREGRVITTFDMYDLIANGDKSKDAQLLPGDVIYVPAIGRLVALAGSVNIPGIFELKDHDTLGEVIRYAGGLTTTASAQRAILERIDAHNVRKADDFPMTADGLGRPLQDGDVVRFLHISPKFENAITLRGNVALPGRYAWHDGMRVKDLIPDRDFLVTYEYWKRQNRLALNPANQSFQLAEEMEPPELAATRVSPSGDGMFTTRQTTPSLGNPNKTTDQQKVLEKDRTTEFQRITQEDIKNQVKRSAAEINWEYAVIQRMNPNDLTAHLVPFNLGKAIEGDEQQNLKLEPGDVVTIFSQSDMQVPIAQQSKFVRLEGEFRSAGVYQVESGETLRHLMNRVGGFTPQAYLYGAEFTRESIREDQQKRLDEYINQLEKAIERNAGVSQNPADAAVQAERVEGQRRLLEKMRQLRATGRIVLELRPNAGSMDSFPDLVLEDGDRMFVPFRPSTVNVIGSVYNSNAFLFKAGKTVSDYLRLSGGITRDGDRKRAFVIRANGSTVSNQEHAAMIVNTFNNLRLMPGDTVVVPEKIDRGAALRGFKDWSQVLSQFALGAAAAQVFLQ